MYPSKSNSNKVSQKLFLSVSPKARRERGDGVSPFTSSKREFEGELSHDTKRSKKSRKHKSP